MLNIYKRYQKRITIEHIFPTRSDGKCACGCGNNLLGRKKKWFSDFCKKKALNHYYIIKGDVDVIRYNLYARDNGFCVSCGVYDENWQADHIIPVFKGGGACSLDNFQTLCTDCHKEKTFLLDRIPNCNNVQASSFNIFPSSFNTVRTDNNIVAVDVVRDTMVVSD